MHNFIKKISLCFLAVLCALTVMITPAFADYDYHNLDTGYDAIIEDGADLLTDSEELQLLEDMEGITRYGNVAFVSTDYNRGSVDNFAEDYLFDNFGRTSATVFVVDMDNREIYIYSYGSIYKTITKSYAYTITDNVYTYASAADYYTCASKTFSQINTLLEGRKIAQPMKYISNALLALVLGAVICYIIVRISTPVNKVSNKEILGTIYQKCDVTKAGQTLIKTKRVYTPPSSGGGGGSSGGGGGSSGGGGGGGGGGGHSF